MRFLPGRRCRWRLAAAWLCCLLLPAFAGAVNTETNFGGIGIDGVRRPDGRIEVRQVVSGGPGHLAGIRRGDIITHVDGARTEGNDFAALVQKRLRGVAGTPVVLTVHRDGTERPLTFRLVRRQLQITRQKENR
jgi:C-terminal processing protease CtpA/Prc